MKKHLFAFLLVLAATYGSYAGTVTVQNAQTVALNFFKNTSAGATAGNNLSATLKFTKTEPAGDVDFYVFDITPAKGFVIVAADDNVEPVIGYSTEGNFSPNNIKGSPINDWITTTSTKIRTIVKMNVQPDLRIISLWNGYKAGTAMYNSSRSSTVSPMVTTTWNQEPYYNNLCPFYSADQQRAVTGCVATAMAQIMKFWNYPAHGTGSYSYTPGSYPAYGVLSANFGATTYNWSNMPGAISSSNATDIATLMYHCGVAVAMDYGDDNQGGSGAYVIGTGYPSAQQAYGTYFGYNASAMKGIYQSNYTSANWIAALEAELNAGRPIQYMGFDPGGGGHTWVCDGYDANNLLHMNWGWGGYGNGYFSVSNLSVAGYNFSTNDAALIGIQPSSVTTTCNTPAGLTSSAITTTTATVSWGAVSGALTYSLQYKASSASTWSTVSVSGNSFNLTGLTAGTTYNFQVQTVCSGGSSAYSTASSFTTTAQATCGVPASLAASSITTSSAIVSWGGVTGATSYNLQYKLSSAGTWTTINVSNTSSSLTGLTAGSTYNYQVQTICSGGSSAYSTASSFTTTAQTSCGIAIGLAVSSVTTNSAVVLWVAVGGGLSYNLQYKASSASNWTTVPVTGITTTLTGLTESTTYNFQVQTVCSGGASSYSTASNFTTLTSCGATSGLTASAVTTSSATLGWTAISGATSYNIQYKTSAGTSWTTVTSTTNSYNLTGLTAGTAYNFQVQTICSSGSAAYSAAASFTTTSAGPVSYCTSKGTSTTYEYIKAIAVGTFSNTSGNNSGYGNFNSMSIPMGSGTTKSVTLTPGFSSTSSYPENWTVYIDYNKNGSFTDAGEKVFSSVGTALPANGTFTVPAGLSGTSTMRIIMSFTTGVAPCGSYYYGETEDYTVNFSSTGVLGSLAGIEAVGGTFNSQTEEVAVLPLLYPNPASDQVNVNLTPIDDLPLKVEVVSLMGQIVLQQIVTGSDRVANIDLSQLVPGVYLVRSYTGDRARTEKLIKQ